MSALPVLVVRPRPGADRTLEAARAMGLDAAAYPLFAVEAVPWEPVPREAVDALLLGSANALRHAGPRLADYAGLPAYAVGETTARAAREAGLDVVTTGTGGLQPVLDGVAPAHRRLLRLAGRKHTPLLEPAGVTLIERVVYASVPVAMERGLEQALRAPALVLLHSGEAAAHFALSCAAAGIARERIALAAIARGVAARAGDGWAQVRSASRANDAALLALAAEMCQEAGKPS